MVLATTSALAPGYEAETTTSGGVISGYRAIGKENKEITPAKVKTMEITIAKRGRSIKILENIGYFTSAESDTNCALTGCP